MCHCRRGLEEDMQQSSGEDFDLPPPTFVHPPHPSMSSSSSVELLNEESDLEIEETEDAIVTHVLEQSIRECNEVGR